MSGFCNFYVIFACKIMHINVLNNQLQVCIIHNEMVYFLQR
jgi:hypothetical protein